MNPGYHTDHPSNTMTQGCIWSFFVSRCCLNLWQIRTWASSTCHYYYYVMQFGKSITDHSGGMKKKSGRTSLKYEKKIERERERERERKNKNKKMMMMKMNLAHSLSFTSAAYFVQSIEKKQMRRVDLGLVLTLVPAWRWFDWFDCYNT